MVREVQSTAEYNQIVSKGKVVADFYANWCGPCMQIAPYYASLAAQFPNVTFIKVNVDIPHNRAAMQYAQVRAMPTFVFYHNGAMVDRLQGANTPYIQAKVAALSKR